MSGAVQRFLDRATGAARPGLRPRLPARFETGGFLEVSEEVSASPPETASAPPPGFEPQDGAARVAPSAMEAPEAQRGRPAIGPYTPPEPPASPPQPMRAMPLEPTSAPLPLIPPDPLRTAAAPDPRADPEAERSGDPQASRVMPEPKPDVPRRASAATAPEPLLPVRPVEMAVTERLGAAGPRPEPAPPEPSPPEPRAEPEITIHIGRLDIAAPAPVRTPAKARRERPALPSLDAYLNGGSS